MRFFISDPHFAHNNIIKYCNRPFTDANHMNEVMIANWNAVIKADDIVYCLGDFAMREPKLYADRLLGEKILIIGNHDDKLKSKTVFKEMKEYIQLEIGGRKVNLSHYPYLEQLGPHDSQFRFKMMNDDGNWLLHGHTHNSSPKIVKKSINCCVEHWNYTPIPEEEIMKIMESVQ